MDLNEQKDILGKIFFILSILMLVYMLVTPLNDMITHMDEYFTVTVINFPILDILNITANDAHPPLHYLILKIVSDFLTILGVNFDKIFVYKLVSISSYFIILVFSITKIKKEWGYLTAGLFSFSLAVMSEFFIHFVMIRMYSLAVLWVVLAFIYLKDVLDTNKIKPWFLLTIFSVLGALTHYFAAVTLVVMYILIFIHFLISNREKLKYWIISAVFGIILYSPWIPAIPNQISSFGSKSTGAITLNKAITLFGYFGHVENVVFSLIALLILFIIIVMYRKYSIDFNATDKFYIISGVWVYLGVIAIGILTSVLYFERYILPATAILWLVISIMVTKINNKKEFFISFALILILLIAGTGHMIQTNDEVYNEHISEKEFFNKLSQDENSMVILYSKNMIMYFIDYSNITDMYCVNHFYIWGESLEQLHDVFNFKETSVEGIPDIVKNNPDKNIYLLTWGEKDLGDNITQEVVLTDGLITYTKLSVND